jgi:hypothetical protein
MRAPPRLSDVERTKLSLQEQQQRDARALADRADNLRALTAYQTRSNTPNVDPKKATA